MKVLVTGAGGFLGAWVIRRLLAAGVEVRAFDIRDDRRLVLQFVGDDASSIEWCVGDIVSTEAVIAAADGCDSIVHLAGVLTPFCREQPVAGARINVIGTLNVFEAARTHGMAKVIYTSSAGVFGPDDGEVPCPTTHYGAYKLANEGSARAYWEDARVASIGFRPFVVYGPGRESGLSAGPTLACRAAAWNQPYTIPFGGRTGLVYVEDVADAYVAAVRRSCAGAHTINLPGVIAGMDEVVAQLVRIVPGAKLGAEGPPLPIAADVRNDWDSPLLAPLSKEKTLEDGLRRTVEYYRAARTAVGRAPVSAPSS